jgi:hypothetical protein
MRPIWLSNQVFFEAAQMAVSLLDAVSSGPNKYLRPIDSSPHFWLNSE